MHTAVTVAAFLIFTALCLAAVVLLVLVIDHYEDRAAR